MRTNFVVAFLVMLSVSACEEKKSAPAAASSAAPATPAAKNAPAPAAADPKVSAASCDVIKTESICREYGAKNIEAAGVDFIKGLCTGGDFKTEPCPKDKRVGSCETPEGTKVYYSTGAFPMAADKAQKACKDGLPAGEWKAGQ